MTGFKEQMLLVLVGLALAMPLVVLVFHMLLRLIIRDINTLQKDLNAVKGACNDLGSDINFLQDEDKRLQRGMGSICAKVERATLIQKPSTDTPDDDSLEGIGSERTRIGGIEP